MAAWTARAAAAAADGAEHVSAERFGPPEQEITELRLAISIEADDLAIEHAAATSQVASQSFE